MLGGLAVLSPRLPRLKEWAYAGMIFDLTGASASHAALGDPTDKIVAPIIILAIVAASWALRPESRRLGDGMGRPVGLFRQRHTEARLEAIR